MSHARYAQYKDSGIEWLGEVPAHWDTKRIQWLFRRTKTVNHPDAELLSVYRDYGVIPKSSRDDNFNKPSEDLGSYQLVKCGDLVLNKMKTWQGSIAVSDHEGIVSPAYIVATPISNAFDLRYIHYLLRSPAYVSQYLRYSAGIRPNQWDLGFEEFRLIEALLPPLAEQRAIAAFLDRETTRIDGLIAKQEQLIALLQEKRKAIISHAVTHGLNPDAPMKDSGVEWLGMVPAHWSIYQNRRLFYEVIDFSERGDEELLTVSHLTGVTPRSEKNVNMIMAETLEGYKRCQAGDTVINTMWAWMGALGTARQEGVVSPSYNVYRVRPRMTDVVDPLYLDYLYRTEAHIIEINRYSKGVWSSRLRLYPQSFFEMSLPCPPIEEQKAIVEYLDRETAKIDTLIDKTRTAIDLLKEHRTSLISAAVTGKIDVRGR
jgi:type I restriction enzyme, S subunit